MNPKFPKKTIEVDPWNDSLNARLGTVGVLGSIANHLRMLAFLVAIQFVFAPLCVLGATYYVDVTRTDDLGDGTSWSAAKKTIQAAVDLTVDGDTVLVTNGVYDTGSTVTPGYACSNRVCITNLIVLRSINGPEVTSIVGAPGSNGSNDVDSIRCVFMELGASLDGFTLTNGFTMASGDSTYDQSGGAAKCRTVGRLTNCVISGNMAANRAGGIYEATLDNCVLAGNRAYHGGGASRSKLSNCTLKNNEAISLGGGMYEGTLTNCTLVENTAGSGAAICSASSESCLMISNNATGGGGGAYGGTHNNCRIEGNVAGNGGAAIYSTLNNCLVVGNTANYGGASRQTKLFNCTLSANTANSRGGGSYLCTLVNCIAWGNQSIGEPAFSNHYNSAFTNSCTAPMPTNGINNTASNPLFTDAASGNYNLLVASPCVDAGDNTYAPADVLPYDLAGDARIQNLTVDMGAYESSFLYYVDASQPDDSADGTSWATAKKTIQAAVDLTVDGYFVWVTNGVYDEGGMQTPRNLLTNRVCITNAITLCSVNGPEVTSIVGADDGGGCGLAAMRGVYLTNSAALIGFTISNGYTMASGEYYFDRSGGGVFLATNCVVSNCIMSGCVASETGGGVITYYGGSVDHSTMSENAAPTGGGGARVYRGGKLSNCIIKHNTAVYGAGVYVHHSGLLTGCTVSSNGADYGGGIYFDQIGGSVVGSTLIGNVATQDAGGIYCASGGVVSNCVLTGNSAVTRAGGVYLYQGGLAENCTLEANSGKYGGGAMFITGGEIRDCVFSTNTATYGGGAYFSGAGGMLENSSFSNNHATFEGGGIFCNSGGVADGCTLSSNTAQYRGGGIYFHQGGSASGCTMVDNSTEFGGGAYLNAGGSVSNCLVTKNVTLHHGGGVYILGAEGVVSSSRIVANHTGNEGGGIRMSDGVVNNSLISENEAGNTGGGVMFSGSGVLNNCTVVDNSSNNDGKGVYMSSGGTINNCVIWSNAASVNTYLYSTGQIIRNTCTTGGITNGVDGCTTSNPLFVDVVNSNYQLRVTSPAIDTGDNTYAPTNVSPYDLAGDPRILNLTVDMGAYESSFLYYVDASQPDDSGDGTTWTTAKKTIQAAVDLADIGYTVLVTNGAYDSGSTVTPGYACSNRVCITKAITLRSINGPEVTSIVGAPGANGSNDVDSIRCVRMAANSVLDGFTLTNGSTMATGNWVYDMSGGGVSGYPGGMLTNCILSGNTGHNGGGSVYGTLNNCTLRGNSATYRGGAASQSALVDCVVEANVAEYGGGVYQGTLTRCTLTENTTTNQGGGAYWATLNNCTLSNNSARTGGGARGGELNDCVLTYNQADFGGASYEGTLNHCTISRNSAVSQAGGAYGATLNYCTLFENTAYYGGGSCAGTLRNCMVFSNSASSGGAASGGTLINCSITANAATNYGGGTSSSVVKNSIVWGNYCVDHPANSNFYKGAFTNTCTAPLPTNGVNNIAVDPLFVDMANSNLQLQAASPCINAGNNAYAPTNMSPNDLAGNLRIVANVVDMGAYECQHPTAIVLYDFVLSVDHGAVRVHWITASEVDTVGFVLERQRDDGAWLRVHTGIILAQGEGGLGATYSLVDSSAVEGETYHYRLTELEIDGGRTAYEVELEARGPFEIRRMYIDDGQLHIRWMSWSGESYRILRAESPCGPFECFVEAVGATPPENVYVVNLDGQGAGFYVIQRIVEVEE